ncbi:hypothetical protein [Ornithinimicrobium kibberense]|uniref:hypothetical protein n=1 Tax=Ornithinimicrobium kibberense TaxID=282060 RepID=UPI0036238A2A
MRTSPTRTPPTSRGRTRTSTTRRGYPVDRTSARGGAARARCTDGSTGWWTATPPGHSRTMRVAFSLSASTATALSWSGPNAR